MDAMISKETEEHMEVLCKSLTDITLNRRLDSKTILYGVQAFLMALAGSGHAESTEIGTQLVEMSKYWLESEPGNVENDTQLLH